MIRATENACKRTRNRVREHPELVELRRDVVPIIDGREGVLFRCSCHPENPWVGWLPADEIVCEPRARDQINCNASA